MPTVVTVGGRRGPGCIVSSLWYILVGWWASFVAVTVAWFCMSTVIGIPLGVAIINSIPKIVALREPSQAGVQIITLSDTTVIATGQIQHNIIIRAIWFLLVGWWLSAACMYVAWLLCATIIGMPAGFWLFDRVPMVLSLRR